MWRLRPSIGFLILFSVAIVCFNLSAHAQTPASIKEISKKTVAMPAIKDCKTLGICDLKNAKIIERKIKVLLPNQQAEYATYMTDFRFVLEVDKPSSIPNYGIVQFMKGCMYESTILPDGTEAHDFTYIHKNFGEYRLVKHDTWVIDSSHEDPLATSSENYGRFDLLKWNADPADFDADKAAWYFDGEPTHGTVFKADLLGTTGLIESSTVPTARNSSLELETCLFKITDLPEKSDASGIGVDRSKALWCGTWDHKYAYDFKNGKVVSETAISPVCASQAPGLFEFNRFILRRVHRKKVTLRLP